MFSKYRKNKIKNKCFDKKLYSIRVRLMYIFPIVNENVMTPTGKSKLIINNLEKA